ncbi:uncharacterized protein EI90DRAFT_3281430 [Cantharellus anzutake]|uniref:uncharacterized protein n=1 Tax=Cantharellus anzutake TaxID=1750568 RepID=UPI001908203D|nr:uncharacterized protein EI90DRAFT_3281430 [Cantharellus anzutake]KAF8327915.1 hypothetical protein EI90DRAFT_3281430 [Cantharellus anzutake]
MPFPGRRNQRQTHPAAGGNPTPQTHFDGSGAYRNYGQPSQQYQGHPNAGAYQNYNPQHQNGHGHGGHPPHNADSRLWDWFIAVDTDHSGEISASELQRALVNGNWTAFDVDTCKMLMSIFDTDRSGSIDFTEFAGLWKYIEEWQKVFHHFDADNSGTIDSQELSNALRQFGYNLNHRLLGLLQSKFESLPDEGYSIRKSAPGITFDRFVRACVTVKTLTEAFQRLDTDRDGWITINYETFLATILSAP